MKATANRRKTRRVVVATLLGAAVVGWLAGARAGRVPRYGGNLRVEISELPTDLDPTQLDGEDAALVAACVYEGLTRAGPHGAEAGLATRWIHDDEDRRWVFQLRSGVVFHDGQPCNAEAVSRSLHRLADPRVSLHAWILRDLVGWSDFAAGRTQQIEGVYVVSTHEIELHFADAIPDLPARLALSAAGIVHWQGLVPSGTGAFRAVGAVAEVLRLVAFDRHHRGRPFLDGIDFVAVTTADASAILAGSAAMQRVDPVGSPAVGRVWVRVPAPRLGLALIHPRSRALADIDARRRLASGFDGAVFVRATLSGDGEPAAGIAPGDASRPQPRMEEREGDLMQRPRQPVRIVTAASEPVLYKLGERLQVHLFALGLDARLDALPSPRYAQALRGSMYDIVLLGWTPPYSSAESLAQATTVRSIVGGLLVPVLGRHVPPRWRDLLDGRETPTQSALLESGHLIPLIFYHDTWQTASIVANVRPWGTDLGLSNVHLQPVTP